MQISILIRNEKAIHAFSLFQRDVSIYR